MQHRKYIGLLLVAMFGLVLLTACGSNKTVTASVNCKDNVATQLTAARSNLDKATAELKSVKGKPSEKQAQKDVDAAQATIASLKDCKTDIKPTSSSDKKAVVVDVVRKALKQEGFKNKQIVTDPKLIKKNTAAPGHGVFGKAVSTPAEAVAFLKSGTPQAKEALKAAKIATSNGCAPTTTAQLLDESNWAAAQLKTATEWGGNTYYIGGMKRTGSAKVDKAGTIAVLFVPPGQVACGKVTSLFSMRGACVNPQFELPKPHKPSKPKPKCVPPSIMLPQGVCSKGKYANQAPVPTGGPVVRCPNGYYGRDGKCHTGTYTPPSSGSGSGDSGGSSNVGQGDSGPGATNTVAPPPTSGPAPAPPETSSPATPMPTPTM